MRIRLWGAGALAALAVTGAAGAKDPQPKKEAAPVLTWASDKDGYRGLRVQLNGLRNQVVDARKAGDDKAEALALCKLADVCSRLNDRTEAGELLLRASLLARRLEDSALGNKVTRQIRDIW